MDATLHDGHVRKRDSRSPQTKDTILSYDINCKPHTFFVEEFEVL